MIVGSDRCSNSLLADVSNQRNRVLMRKDFDGVIFQYLTIVAMAKPSQEDVL